MNRERTRERERGGYTAGNEGRRGWHFPKGREREREREKGLLK